VTSRFICLKALPELSHEALPLPTVPDRQAVLLRVAETPELILNRNAVAKLMPSLVGMLEALVCHLHYRTQSVHENDKHCVSDMAAAYVKGQDIPFVSPAHEDPLPHKLGVPAADIMHALLPLTG
jgi:hypothetical protein